METNYQKKMEEQLALVGGAVPSLLLHSCCAPCSSYALECLSERFKITVFFFNPNIQPFEEFQRRAAEQLRLLEAFPAKHPVSYAEGAYDEAAFGRLASGLEREREGGARCALCYELRLRKTAEQARAEGFDFFATTLSVSPHKNARAVNELGAKLSAEYAVPFLHADFKKKDGYRRSIELSKQYGLYRQSYCGCLFSFQR